jgi:hypothetical protein
MNAVLQSLLKLNDTPHRTAIAFGIGVFIAFSPFLGLHTAMAIVTAFALRLSRVALLAGAWINFWALVPSYALGTLIGAAVLGLDGALVQRLDLSHGFGALGPLMAPFVLGNTILAAVCGAVAYRIALAFLVRRAAAKAADSGFRAAAGEGDR